jgi:ribosomal subunit interface protein
MQLSIAGKQLDVGNALQGYVTDHLDKNVKKYFEHAIKADVVFSKQAHLFRADIIVNEGTGHNVVIKGTADSDDVYAAFDSALARIATQLRRYKRRIKDHHKPKLAELGIDEIRALKGVKYVISPLSEENEIVNAPVIVAEKPTSIETLTVAEAVMRMDLAQLPALLFINQLNGRVNVVYQRADGNISWVDTVNGA